MPTAEPVPDVPSVPTAPVSRRPRVVLFGRAACHLCAAARAVVAAVCAESDEPWDEVDIDAGGRAPDGRPLADIYGELVPVVEVDGVRVGYWQIDADRLKDAITTRRGPGTP